MRLPFEITKFPFEKIRFKIVKKLKPEYEKISEVGDYFKNWIIAKDMEVDWYNELILIHEFIEYYLISELGIDWKKIDRFDTDKEFKKKNIKRYKLYRKAHRLALKVEKMICELLGKNWQEYNNFIKNYGEKKSK